MNVTPRILWMNFPELIESNYYFCIDISGFEKGNTVIYDNSTIVYKRTNL